MLITTQAFSSDFYLIDSDKDVVVSVNENQDTLIDGQTIQKSDLPKNFSISFNPDSSVSNPPVILTLFRVDSQDSKKLHVQREGKAPYTLFGDDSYNSDYKGASSASLLTVGRYKLETNNHGSLAFEIVSDEVVPEPPQEEETPERDDVFSMDRSLWQLSASHNSRDLSNAIDNKKSSRWTTSQIQRNGQMFQIDLSYQANINAIELVTSDGQMSYQDYPRSYDVQLSNDGQNWTRVRSGKGSKSGVTRIEAINVDARYIRIIQTGSDGYYWWSIHDLNVYASTQVPAEEAPTCNDGILNGNETDVDCGGSVCGRCTILSMCMVNDDCQTGSCSNARCQSNSGGVGTQTANFEADNTTDFLNPERGWMERGSDRIFDDARDGNSNHRGGYSVVWSDVGGSPWSDNSGNPFRLDNYRTRDLPSSLLSELDDIFAVARDEGIKLKLRFAYNYSGGSRDTTKEWMIKHINQLGPVLTDNADVIASMDAGFIGAWGEMHSSTDLKDERNDTVEVVQALLDVTPDWMNVHVRYPRVVDSLFGDPGYNMDLADRFSGSDQSRIGWYNDCLWSNKGNTGTYNTGNGFTKDRDIFEKVGRYAATSGETCNVGGINFYNSCDHVVSDMKKIGGPDTLFRGFWGNIYERLQDEGCYDEVTRRLGYRLQLVSATLPMNVTRGQQFNISLDIRNTGFGKVYNPRPLDLVFVADDGSAITQRLSSDARKALPLAGETVTAGWNVRAPSGLKSGHSYDLYLRLPDPSSKLKDDNRYSIRLANDNDIWDANTGRHDLGMTVLAN